LSEVTTGPAVLLDGPSLQLGRYRCPPADERWEGPNDIGPLAHVVFPERPVTITRVSTGPQLGDRNWALLYLPGQRYERRLVDPEGDECTYVALSAELYADLLADRQAPMAFRAGRVLVDDPAWVGYQECLLAAPYADPGALEQRLRVVLREVLRRPHDEAADDDPAVPRAGNDQRVHEACRILATRLDERVTLPDVAEAVGLSTYHFCRLFRAGTGLTVHAYRKRLRLREAFASCASRPDRKLSEVAVSAGYASHSHMTTDFQAALAMTPSGVRDRYARGSAEAGIFNLR
jgi:AraC-like DNA-binding protein